MRYEIRDMRLWRKSLGYVHFEKTLSISNLVSCVSHQNKEKT
ncbi:hypothetical protein Emtol_1885 [Emticicia oligotrophica DSM 17448]|uniref:Uncharacterized protein n=1 Tax=Emticicia oligotrophica (strain DSM 17448 / CIP 109782 / MTCC 6937 / GPTSA100-15) TaxID=929562 RepID=A0ABN4AEE0_EMTOG|nr:hypothetical protein Emtol_1885 [Emticicia oligotrophica DSM 17448]